MDSHALLQGIFLTQGSNPGLLLCRQILYYLSHQGMESIKSKDHCCCCSIPKLCPTLWPHGLRHTRLPCPSLSPEVCSNSCPLSQWCYLSLPLLPPSLFAFNLSQHQDLFQWVGSSHQVAKVLELQLQDLCFLFVACLFICFVPFSFGFPIFPLLMSSNSMYSLNISPLLVYRL